MKQEEIEETLAYIKEKVIGLLVFKYGYNDLEAIAAFNASSLNSMMNENPHFVFHYSVEYWAFDVHEEYS